MRTAERFCTAWIEADAKRPCAADTAESEVVVVLAEVRELDDRIAAADLGARERQRELVGDDLEACRGLRRRCCDGAKRKSQRHADRGREDASHRRIVGRSNFRAPGMIASASVPSQSSSSAA